MTIKNPRKITLVIIFLLILLSTLFSAIFFIMSEQGYTIKKYKNDTGASRGLYSYDLGGLRLLFAAEKDINKSIAGMKLLHLNDFWDPERCAGMIPSIFEQTAFFVDRKIEINSNGNLVKKSFIYKFDFNAMSLSEVTAPVLAERIYRHGEDYVIASLLGNRLILLYTMDETQGKLRLDHVTLMPEEYTLSPKSDFLEWCDTSSKHCVTKKEYLGFDNLRIRGMHTYNEQVHTYTYMDFQFNVENKYKNVFLGY